MPVTATVGRKTYESTRSQHAEELMFRSGLYDNGDFTVTMNAWPCTGTGKSHGEVNCDALFKSRSAGRTITVEVTADQGGYAADHGRPFGSTGIITYHDGVRTIA